MHIMLAGSVLVFFLSALCAMFHEKSTAGVPKFFLLFFLLPYFTEQMNSYPTPSTSTTYPYPA